MRLSNVLLPVTGSILHTPVVPQPNHEPSLRPDFTTHVSHHVGMINATPVTPPHPHDAMVSICLDSGPLVLTRVVQKMMFSVFILFALVSNCGLKHQPTVLACHARLFKQISFTHVVSAFSLHRHTQYNSK